MSKILYYCDIHNGTKRPPYDVHSVTLHGDRAIDYQKAIIAYAEQCMATAIIHGGDEAFFDYNPDIYKRRAEEISAVIKTSKIPIHRLIGNHDPENHLKELGFITNSFNRMAANIDIVIMQPQISKTNNNTLYSYDPEQSLDLLARLYDSRNIVIASHWAFDRIARGYNKVSGGNKGYRYHDFLKPVSEKLSAMAGDETGRHLTLHGHEHRFSLTKNMGFQCLVMPSIIQKDEDTPEKPCGLFAEITDNADDRILNIAFKKIVCHENEPDNFTVHTVTQNYMNRYYRPVI